MHSHYPLFLGGRGKEITTYLEKENWSPERICDPLEDTQQAMGRQGMELP